MGTYLFYLVLHLYVHFYGVFVCLVFGVLLWGDGACYEIQGLGVDVVSGVNSRVLVLKMR